MRFELDDCPTFQAARARREVPTSEALRYLPLGVVVGVLAVTAVLWAALFLLVLA
jgi:hypothetical protein